VGWLDPFATRVSGEVRFKRRIGTLKVWLGPGEIGPGLFHSAIQG